MRGPVAARMAGEGILIVVSILLAFGIDAWWGRRQEDREREALRDGLAAEFISLRGVVTLAVSDADSLERSTRALLEAAGDRRELSEDSIRSLSRAVVSGGGATLATPRYDAAVRSGNIALLREDSLLVALSTFDSQRATFDKLIDILIDSFYQGPLHDLRLELGSLSVLNPQGGRTPAPAWLVPSDLNELIQRRSVLAVIEQVHVLRVNQREVLRGLDETVRRVSTQLQSSRHGT